MKKNTHDMQKGFTLVETITVITVSTILLVGVTSFIMQMYRSNNYALEQAFAISYARSGVLKLVESIRESTISQTGSYPIAEVSTSSMLFYSNIDTDDDIERVRYYLDGETFKRGVIKPSGTPAEYVGAEATTTIAEDVRNAPLGTDIFTYFDNTGTEVIDFDDITSISYVQVNLVININPSRAPEDFTLRSSVSIRNVKNNL
jgi:prepilin-type N-terminal cleavage/methylation domain-containing protein